MEKEGGSLNDCLNFLVFFIVKRDKKEIEILGEPETT